MDDFTLPSENLNTFNCIGGKIALKGAHGKYLVAESNGQANANRPRASSWETFEVIDVGRNKYAFKSYHKKFLVADARGSLNANSSKIGPWEKFDVVCHDGKPFKNKTTLIFNKVLSHKVLIIKNFFRYCLSTTPLFCHSKSQLIG